MYMEHVYVCRDSATSPPREDRGAGGTVGAQTGGDVTCDLHVITGQVIHVCKELTGYTQIYGRFTALAVGFLVAGRVSVCIYVCVIECVIECVCSSTDTASCHVHVCVCIWQTETQIRLPIKASTLPHLTNALVVNLLSNLDAMAERLDPPPRVRASRSMNLKAHALYETGDKEAEESLMWGRRHLFLVNNLHAVLQYLTERLKSIDHITRASGKPSTSFAVGVDPKLSKDNEKMVSQDDHLQMCRSPYLLMCVYVCM